MDKQIKYVTSMNRAIYENIGEDMLTSFDEYWPDGQMIIYTEEDDFSYLGSPRIQVRSLHEIPGYDEFNEMTSSLPIFTGRLGDNYDYRRNVHAFNKKAFAQIDGATDHPGYLFWLDSDIISLQPLPRKSLEIFMDGYFMCVMRRKTWHLCSSFVGWDCTHSFAPQFFQHYYMQYVSGNILTLPQWDDAFILEEVIKNMEGVHDIAANITGEGPYNVFDEVFMNYARHFKGNKNTPYRYTQLLEIVKKTKPKRILEVGTWNGDRAIQMAQCAPGVEYIGLDLFEDATKESDEKEKNVKAHYALKDVEQRLYASGVRRFQLHRGDTKTTFPQVAEKLGPESVDLIYIDGGHSFETIRSDYENARKVIKKGGLIILDDYYTEMPEEELSKFGCQAVLGDVEHEILPIKDRVQGGGRVQFATVQC